MIENNFLNINIVHQDGPPQFVCSEPLDKQSLYIKQKIILIAKEIYSSTRDKTLINQISFDFKDPAHLQIKIKKTDGESECSIDELNDEMQFRTVELARLVHELGLGVLAAAAAEPASPPEPFRAEAAGRDKKTGIIGGLFRFIQRWYATTFTLNSALGLFVNAYFAHQKDQKDLESKWQRSEKAINNLADKLYQKVNHCGASDKELFSREEILDQVLSKLTNQFQILHESYTGRIISIGDMRLLKNERKIVESADRFSALASKQEEAIHAQKKEISLEILGTQKDLESLQKLRVELEKEIKGTSVLAQKRRADQLVEINNETQVAQQNLENLQKELEEHDHFVQQQRDGLHEAQKYWQQVVDSIPVLDMPFEKLSSVPFNVFTEESLTRTWVRVFTELAEQGGLQRIGEDGDPAIQIKQTRYGDAYLFAYQLMPQVLKEVLKDLTSAVDLEKVEKFIRSQPNAWDLKALPLFDKDQRGQLVYQRFIKPLLDENLDKLWKTSKDFVSLAESLKDGRSPLVVEWVDKAIKRLEINGIDATERQTLELTRERLTDHLIVSLEEFGVKHFLVSGDQLSRLKQAREDLAIKRENAEQTESLLVKFKDLAVEFEKKITALNNHIENERQRNIRLEMEIPDLEIPVIQLDKEAFEHHIHEQEQVLNQLQENIANLRKKKGKKAAIPHQWTTDVNRLKQNHLPMLKNALNQWDKRQTILPVSLLTTIKGSLRQLASLTQTEKELIHANREKVQQKIKELELLGQPTNAELRKQKILLDKLEQIFENPIKAKERDLTIQKLEAERSTKQQEFAQVAIFHFADLQLLKLSIPTLSMIPVSEANQGVMKLVWEAILQDLKEMQDDQEQASQAYLLYREAIQALSEMKVPAVFRSEMAKVQECLEKPLEFTEGLVQQFTGLEQLTTLLNHQIQAVETNMPSNQVDIPTFALAWTEAAPEHLRELIKTKQREMTAINQKLRVENKAIQETQDTIDNYANIKDPKIKRKGGIALLNKKLGKLQANANQIKQEQNPIKAQIRKLQKILAGEAVELEDHDKLIIPAHQGDIQELSEGDWQIFEHLLNQALGREKQKIEILFDRRAKIAEQQRQLQNLKQDKDERIGAYCSEMKKMFREIDSAKVRVNELAALSIRTDNEALIVEMWQTQLEHCLAVGKLEHVVEGQLTEEELHSKEVYAAQYLTMLKSLAAIPHPAIQEMLAKFKGREVVGNENAPRKLEENLKNFIKQRVAKELATRDSLALTGVELLFGAIEVPPPAVMKTPQKESEKLLLSPYESESLKLLTKALSSAEARQELSLSLVEREQLYGFIAFTKQNTTASKALNAKLCALMDRKEPNMKGAANEIVFNKIPVDNRPYEKIPFGISEIAVETAMVLSFNFKSPQIFAPLVGRLEGLLQKASAGVDISLEEKLTRREIGLIQKCARMGKDTEGDKSLLSRLEAIGMLEQDPVLQELKALSLKSQTLLQNAQDIFAQQAQFQDGDIVANVGRQKVELAGRRATGEEEIHFRFITKYCHGSKIFLDEGKAKQSHLTGAYLHEDYTLADELYSEVWRLDIGSLMPTHMHALLRERYGDDWRQTVQQKYQTIENHIQRNKKKQFSQLENPWIKRMEAGKADYMWGGHARRTERDFEKLADKILAEKEGEPEHMQIMICSEFVTKTTLAALVKLNRELSAELSDLLIQQGQEEEGTKLKEGHNVFELPYSKKEKLNKVHPGRMIDLLVERSCVKQLDPPQIVKQLVR